jgi:hypothetical protein
MQPLPVTIIGWNAIPSGTDWQSVLQKCTQENEKSVNSSTMGLPAGNDFRSTCGGLGVKMPGIR